MVADIFKKIVEKLHSIRFKFTFMVVLLIIFFGVSISIIWYSQSSYYAKKTAIDYSSEVIRISIKDFESSLLEAQGIVTLISLDKDVEAFLSNGNNMNPKEYLLNKRKIDKILSGYFGSYRKYYRSIFVLNETGVSSNYGEFPIYEDVMKTSWYRKVLNSSENEIVIALPYYPSGVDIGRNKSNYKHMVLSVSKKIKDSATGNKIGVVVAEIWTDILINIFDSNLRDNGTIMIINNSSDEVVFQPKSEILDFELKKTDILKLKKNFINSTGNFYANIAHKEFLIVYSSSDFTEWTTVAIIPVKILLQEFNEIRHYSLFISAIYSLLALVITFIMTSLLTKNIIKLNKAVKDSYHKDLELSADIRSRDEIQQLYQQFKVLLERIRILIYNIKKSEKEKRKAEIKILQAQINPHFLYNTLNTIKYLAIANGVSSIGHVSESLSKLLHINMNEDTELITLEEEINYVKSYISIQEYKYAGKFMVNFEIENGIEKYRVLKLLLQPIVENSLVHGFYFIRKLGVVVIKAFEQNNTLKITVRDNGNGINSCKLKIILDGSQESEHIGLYNVNKRIKLYHGEEYGLSVFSEENLYTVVEITLPIIKTDTEDCHV